MIGIPLWKVWPCWVKFWKANVFPLESFWQAEGMPDTAGCVHSFFTMVQKSLGVQVYQVHKRCRLQNAQGTKNRLYIFIFPQSSNIYKLSYELWFFRCCISRGLTKSCRGLEPYSVRSNMASIWVGPTCGCSGAFDSALMRTHLFQFRCLSWELGERYKRMLKNVAKGIDIYIYI